MTKTRFACSLLVALALLTAVGGVLFNLAGAEDASDVAVGSAFVGAALLYLTAAVQLARGDSRLRRPVVVLAAAHALFNLVVKVAVEGETFSVLFVVLGATITVLLSRAPGGRPAYA